MNEVGPAPDPLSRWTFPTLVGAACWTLLVLPAQIAMVAGGVSVWMIAGLDTETTAFQQWQSLLAVFSTTLLAGTVCFLLYRGNTLRVVGWRLCNRWQLLLVLLLVVPMAVIVSEVGNWTEILVSRAEPSWFHDFRAESRAGILELSQRPWWWAFLVGCLLPGLGEELYWRGFLSRGLVRRHGVLGGSLAAALLFGAVHILPVQAFGAFLLGLGMQFVFLTTRSLPAAVVLHTLNNAFGLSLARHAEVIHIDGMSDPENGVIVHTPGWLVFASLAAVCTLFAALARKRTRWRMPDGSLWSPGYPTAAVPAAELSLVAESAKLGRGLVAGIALSLAAFAVALWRAAEFGS